MPDTASDPLATFTDADLSRMVPLAWRDAARSWQEYRAATADNSDDGRALASMLRDAAWSAEHYWRHLYDACKARGIRPSLLPGGPVSLPRENATVLA